MEDFVKKHASSGLVLLFLLFACRYIIREVWFDEFLTIQIAESRRTLFRIYQAYQIPNNHIVFTVLLSLWSSLWNSVLWLRILPLSGGICTGLLLFRAIRKDCGKGTAFICTASLILSPAYLIYSTALRGYIFGALFAVTAYLSAEKYLRKNSWKALTAYIVSAFLAVGTAPTNLAPLFAVSVLLFPYAAKNRLKWGAVLVMPFVCLILFYYPIRELFIGCLKLGEGWHSASAAAWHFYVSAFLIFLPALLLMSAGYRKIKKSFAVCGILTLLIPLGVYLIFRVPPFPRVFFPLFAVWMISAAPVCRAGYRKIKERKMIPFFIVIYAALLSMTAVTVSDSLFGGERKDDLMSPYYVRPSFSPYLLVQHLEKLRKENPDCVFFLTFKADHPSILYACGWADVKQVMLHDRPNKPKAETLPPAACRVVVAYDEEDLKDAIRRFSLPFPAKIEKIGMYTIGIFL